MRGYPHGNPCIIIHKTLDKILQLCYMTVYALHGYTIFEKEGGYTMEKEYICQCHCCKKIFAFEDLAQDPAKRHLSPCCGSSYSVLNREVDLFFAKYFRINIDIRYYRY